MYNIRLPRQREIHDKGNAMDVENDVRGLSGGCLHDKRKGALDEIKSLEK